MQYYERLKIVRSERNMSQEEVGRVLGISKQQYGKYENGIHLMPIPYFVKACEYIGVSADYILGLPKGLDFPER